MMKHTGEANSLSIASDLADSGRVDEAKGVLRGVLAAHGDSFETLLRLLALEQITQSVASASDSEIWIERLRTVGLRATVRQRYRLAVLFFAIGRYQLSWEQTWIAKQADDLDDQVSVELSELQRILLGEVAGKY